MTKYRVESQCIGFPDDWKQEGECVRTFTEAEKIAKTLCEELKRELRIIQVSETIISRFYHSQSG